MKTTCSSLDQVRRATTEEPGVEVSGYRIIPAGPLLVLPLSLSGQNEYYNPLRKWIQMEPEPEGDTMHPPAHLFLKATHFRASLCRPGERQHRPRRRRGEGDDLE